VESDVTPRRNERRERVEVKHNPEAFVLTEEQAIAVDRAVDELKASEHFYDARDSYALNAQVQMERAP
jgi:hypothetical protein